MLHGGFGISKMGLDFYKGKKVLITGHTGFKGTYLTAVLHLAGAELCGIALEPETDPALFDLTGMENNIASNILDIRDYEGVKRVVGDFKPEIVFHLAAQPIVRTSYEKPRLTFETNVMGTVNILEAVRDTESVRSFLNVTTDKVYLNEDKDIAFTEDMPLDGYDPYSNSKSCSELVTHSYTKSFFADRDISISTARAGNVIGGGDFSRDRIIPDCVRSALKKEDIIIRNPKATRPFQHVLEPLFAYLMIAQRQYEDRSLAGSYNVGPKLSDCISAGELADIFVKNWGEGIKWIDRSDGGPHEAGFLRLDCTKIKEKLDWEPVWDIKRAVKETVSWFKVYEKGGDITAEITRQINAYKGEADV